MPLTMLKQPTQPREIPRTARTPERPINMSREVHAVIQQLHPRLGVDEVPMVSTLGGETVEGDGVEAGHAGHRL